MPRRQEPPRLTWCYTRDPAGCIEPSELRILAVVARVCRPEMVAPLHGWPPQFLQQETESGSGSRSQERCARFTIGGPVRAPGKGRPSAVDGLRGTRADPVPRRHLTEVARVVGRSAPSLLCQARQAIARGRVVESACAAAGWERCEFSSWTVGGESIVGVRPGQARLQACAWQDPLSVALAAGP